MNEATALRRRPRTITQSYSEPDEIYRDRIETAALARRVDRAESARTMAQHDALEAIGW